MPGPYGYAPPPVPYGSSWTPVRGPESSSIRTQAIVSMVLNIVGSVLCCPAFLCCLPGAITAGIAIGRADTDLASGKRLVSWAWGLMVAGILLFVFGWIIYFTAIVGMISQLPTTPGGDL